jgi:hypothetical protein
MSTRSAETSPWIVSGGGLVASQSIVPNAATTTAPINHRTDILPINIPKYPGKIFQRFNLKALNSSVIHHARPHLTTYFGPKYAQSALVHCGNGRCHFDFYRGKKDLTTSV